MAAAFAHRITNWHASEPLDISSPDVHQLFCLPSDTNIVFALTGGRFGANPALYRSTNGGMSWAATPGIGGIDGEVLDYHALTDALYYGENFAGIVYSSVNHGSSWQQIGKQDAAVTLCSLGVSPNDDKIFLAGSKTGILDRSSD